MDVTTATLHKEVMKIDGKSRTVVADFFKNKLFIYSNPGKIECDLDEYENFVGNMLEFAQSKVRERNNAPTSK